jgi:hypothetical protein
MGARIQVGTELSVRSSNLCLAGRYDNPFPTRFLAPIDCSKIALQFLAVFHPVMKQISEMVGKIVHAVFKYLSRSQLEGFCAAEQRVPTLYRPFPQLICGYLLKDDVTVILLLCVFLSRIQ